MFVDSKAKRVLVLCSKPTSYCETLWQRRRVSGLKGSGVYVEIILIGSVNKFGSLWLIHIDVGRH